MNINLGNATVGGEFKVVLKNKDGDVTQETPWNKNLLLDSFFTATSVVNMYGFVGTGSTPPLATNTKLASLIGVASSNRLTSGSNSISGDNTIGYTLTTASYIFRWSIGAIVGNISEWGWSASDNTSSYTLLVRSLIKDANGNPTTIAVTASDQLEIWWRLKKKAPGAIQMAAAETTQTIVLNGVNTSVKCTSLNPQNFSTTSKWNIGIAAECCPSVFVKASTLTVAAVVALQDAAAGSSIASGSSAAEYYLGASWTRSSPSAGVAKYTLTCTFQLDAGASSNPTQVIVLDTYTSSSSVISNSEVITRLTFNPQFVKGPDKILTVSFSYTVTRAP